MYKNITDENTKNSEKSIIKKAIVQKLWVMENFFCVFGFSVKSYVRNTISLSCAKILLTSVINDSKTFGLKNLRLTIVRRRCVSPDGGSVGEYRMDQ